MKTTNVYKIEFYSEWTQGEPTNMRDKKAKKQFETIKTTSSILGDNEAEAFENLKMDYVNPIIVSIVKIDTYTY